MIFRDALNPLLSLDACCKTQGVNSSLEAKMTCMGHYEIKSPIYEKFIEQNKCVRTSNRLKIGSCISTKLFNLI